MTANISGYTVLCHGLLIIGPCDYAVLPLDGMDCVISVKWV